MLGDFDREAILVFLIATFFVDTLFMMLFDGAGYLKEHIRTGSLDFILLLSLIHISEPTRPY